MRRGRAWRRACNGSPALASDNPHIIGIKHMAFAVKDARAALATYGRFLCVPGDAPVHDYAKSREGCQTLAQSRRARAHRHGAR